MQLIPALEPIINELNVTFWEGASRGELWLPLCEDTQRCFWPPAPVSPFSIAAPITWKEVAREGTLIAAVVYRRSYLQELSTLMPYAVGVVALDVGPRIQVHLRDIAIADHTPRQVEIFFDSLLPDGRPVPMARPFSRA